MIQRLQTIYLLLIAVVAGLLLFMDATYFEVQGIDKWTNNTKGTISLGFDNAVWTVNNETVQTDSLPKLTYTLATIVLLAVIGIFTFKNRKLQMMLTAFNYIFMLVLFGLMIWYGVQYKGYVNQEVDTNIGIGLFFPLFLPVFNYLALRRINIDEQLVRSMDRLR